MKQIEKRIDNLESRTASRRGRPLCLFNPKLQFGEVAQEEFQQKLSEARSSGHRVVIVQWEDAFPLSSESVAANFAAHWLDRLHRPI